ncbi:MAG: hypothetical protein Q7R77_02690 [Candidatus Daviesbacteria bacterium]|nr:hypothetical protein [Candidatus Daviesbacteria bacterium]
MQKGTAQLLLLLTVVLLLGVGVYFYKTSKENDLQTAKLTVQKPSEFIDYVNKDFGFEFKYSKELQVKVDTEEEFNKRSNGNFRKNFTGYVGYEPGQVLGAVAVLDQSGSFDNNPFSVWVFDNPDGLTVNGWFDKYWYYPFLWGVFDYLSKSHITPDTEATISGQLTKYKIVSYQLSSPKYLYLSKEKKMYLFRVIGETGDKILSGFKFL